MTVYWIVRNNVTKFRYHQNGEPIANKLCCNPDGVLWTDSMTVTTSFSEIDLIRPSTYAIWVSAGAIHNVSACGTS